MKILLLILSGLSILIMVACSTDDYYQIIGCGGTVEESEYFKEQPGQENNEPEPEQNEIMKTSDPGIH